MQLLRAMIRLSMALLAAALPANDHILSSKAFESALSIQPSTTGTWFLTNDGGTAAPYWIDIPEGQSKSNITNANTNPSLHRRVANWFISYVGNDCTGNEVAKIDPIVNDECYSAIYKSVFISIPTTGATEIFRLYQAFDCPNANTILVLINYVGCVNNANGQSFGSLIVYDQ